VFELVGFPNYPVQEDLEATFTGYQILGPYANGATLAISPGPGDVLYSIGVAPVVSGVAYQGAPAAQNTAGTLTTAEVMGGIVTTTQATGATIAVLLPNGADMDDASQFDVNESFHHERSVWQHDQRPRYRCSHHVCHLPHSQDCG
jgi:hypothetical protein